jgi:hypothetical protein
MSTERTDHKVTLALENRGAISVEQPIEPTKGGSTHPSTGREAPRKPGFLRQVWRRWLRFAEVVGTVQMVVILSIVYFTMLALVAIPFRLLSDPLSLRAKKASHWIKRPAATDYAKTMKDQG